MQKTSGPRRAMAVLLAIALHGALALGLLLRPEEPMPSEIVIDVVLAPPWPQPNRDEPRAPPPPVASRPAVSAGRPANSPAPATARTASTWQVRDAEPSGQEGVRQSLRAGVGCRSADFLALSKAERAACDEKLAAGAKDAPAYAVVSPKLKKAFDGVFECPKGDVWCEYRVGKAPYPGLLALGRKKKSDWD